MLWHHDVLAPWVQQLQHDAERAYKSICSKREGRTALDQAGDNLGIEVASTLEHSRAILAEMIRLLDEGIDFYQGLPQRPAPLPLAPAVHVPTISLPPDVASAKELGPLLHLWDKKLRKYFSPLEKNKPAAPEWQMAATRAARGLQLARICFLSWMLRWLMFMPITPRSRTGPRLSRKCWMPGESYWISTPIQTKTALPIGLGIYSDGNSCPSEGMHTSSSQHRLWSRQSSWWSLRSNVPQLCTVALKSISPGKQLSQNCFHASGHLFWISSAVASCLPCTYWYSHKQALPATPTAYPAATKGNCDKAGLLKVLCNTPFEDMRIGGVASTLTSIRHNSNYFVLKQGVEGSCTILLQLDVQQTVA